MKTLITLSGFVVLVYFISWVFDIANILQYPYKGIIREIVTDQSNTQELSYLYYYDLNSDAITEKIVLKTENQQTQYSIIISNQNGIIDQWNLEGRWIKESLLIDDCDNDNFKELYILSVDNDSLFLYGLKLNDSSEFFINKKYITNRSDDDYNNWDLRIGSSQTFDLDGDRKKELIWVIQSGFSLQPRGIFVFSPSENKIIKTPTMGSVITNYKIVQLDEDKNYEFICGSYAPGNYDLDFPWTDQYSWIFYLAHDLTFLIPPIVAHPYPSAVEVDYFVEDKNTYIAILHKYTGNLNIIPKLEIRDSFGNILAQKELVSSDEYCLFKINNHLYLNKYGSGLFGVNKSLSLEQKSEIKISTKIMLEFDIIKDSEDELIFIDHQKLILTDKNLKILSVTSIPSHLNSAKISDYSIKKIPYANNTLIQSGAHGVYEFEAKPSTFYSFRYVIIFVSSILIILILYLIFVWIEYQILLRKSNNLIQHEIRKGILILNRKVKIKKVNEYLSEQLKINKKLLISNSIDEFFNDYPLIVEKIKRLIQEKYYKETRLVLSTLDIEREYILCVNPMKLFKKFILGYIIIIEEKSNDYERSRHWFELVQAVAHNIKTPLSSVKLNIQTIEMKINDMFANKGPELREDFELVYSELTRIREMAKEFIKITSFVFQSKKRINLSNLFNEIIHALKDSLTSITVELEIDHEVEIITADKKQMYFLFKNLIENSIEAIEGIGKILITATLAQNLMKNNRNYLEIEIIDTGKGIDPALIDSIFDPFFTTKADGSGMGLSIVKRIVDDYEGKIDIYSNHSSTTVKIILPVFNNGEQGG